MSFLIPKKTIYKVLLSLALLTIAIYGGARLYYAVTGGFSESNLIGYHLDHPRWEIKPLTIQEKENVDSILSQEFHYLGKGCQSYVFSSGDGKYVIKLVKYKNFRPSLWLRSLAFIPWVEKKRAEKIAQKQRHLDSTFYSWKLAFEELQKETEVLYLHINSTTSLNNTFTFYDKMGLKHTVDLNGMQFLVQRKAEEISPLFLRYKANGDIASAGKLIDSILALIQSEYERGYFDNDHYLAQNTGLYEGKVIHLDVGQFVKNLHVNSSQTIHQELFNKTWQLRLWLKSHYPELLEYTDKQLKSIIGDAYDSMAFTTGHIKSQN